MTNHGALAILAAPLPRADKLPSPGETDLRWLIALETVTAAADGWRYAGARLLADMAHLNYRTASRVRDRMVAGGVVEYRPGNGRGNRSAFRFLISLKVPNYARHEKKVDTHDDHLSDDGKRWTPDSVKVDTWPDKGGHPNPSTSENANTALKPSVLQSSALSAQQPAGEIIRQLYPDATRSEIDQIQTQVLLRYHPRNLDGYIKAMADKGQLDLPCDVTGPAKHSDACRHAEPQHCQFTWCACRCHIKPVTM